CFDCVAVGLTFPLDVGEFVFARDLAVRVLGSLFGSLCGQPLFGGDGVVDAGVLVGVPGGEFGSGAFGGRASGGRVCQPLSPGLFGGVELVDTHVEGVGQCGGFVGLLLKLTAVFGFGS